MAFKPNSSETANPVGGGNSPFDCRWPGGPPGARTPHESPWEPVEPGLHGHPFDTLLTPF